MPRDPVRGQPAAARLHLPAGAAGSLVVGPSAARGGRCTSPRRSGSVTRGATWRSPTSCGGCTRIWRSTGSRSIPVTSVLVGARRAHPPASAELASESAHMAVGERRAPTSTASRRSGGWTRSCSRTSWCSTTSCATSSYDLWIGDEAWDLDHFLHENPELKTAPYAWLTDFVGLAADARRRRARGGAVRRLQRRDDRARSRGSRACAIGRSSSASPTTSSPGGSGLGLPSIREWTERHYDFCGYITGFDPRSFADLSALRASLGYGADERVCIVTVGGSGVGGDLLSSGDRVATRTRSGWCRTCG